MWSYIISKSFRVDETFFFLQLIILITLRYKLIFLFRLYESNRGLPQEIDLHGRRVDCDSFPGSWVDQEPNNAGQDQRL